jgi:hypothetical protein
VPCRAVTAGTITTSLASAGVAAAEPTCNPVAETANLGKITVDADGSFYTLEGDQLRWWRYEEQAGAWAPGSGRVLDVGWGRFDLIAASGNGGLQARDAVGALHRFRLHAWNRRPAAGTWWARTTRAPSSATGTTR